MTPSRRPISPRRSRSLSANAKHPRARATAPRSLAKRILDTLEKTHPEARCALEHSDPFQLSIATILSAQCTDERVNQVTPALFGRFPTAAALAAASHEEVEEIIRSTGFFRAKARSVIGCARTLVERHDGRVPRSMADLVKLPGIGRKTANVVLGHAYDINEGIAVDTHVLRVSNRLGLAQGDDPVRVEQQLMALIPRRRWTRTTDLLIFHGRKVCDARRPRCGRCPLFAWCAWEGRQAHAAETGPPAARGATRRGGASSAAGPRTAGRAGAPPSSRPRPRSPRRA